MSTHASVTTASRAKSRSTSRERGGIQSLERAAAILDAVAGKPEGIGITDLSARVGLHPSTAFHLAKTLVNLGFLFQIPDNKRYRIGSRLVMLAAGALDETLLLSLATPILERLSAETSYTAHLAVRSNHQIIVVARTAATGLLQLSDRVGAARPAHATAIGKMLLSAVPSDELQRLLDKLPLLRFTDNTITDRQALLREIEKVRRQGVAYDDCELDVDVRCVAVAVRDFAGRCAGAMGLSGPAWRLTSKRMETVLRKLGIAAAELSGQLGYAEGKSAMADNSAR
jgi:IclR family acetate operon transcriptional repressor